MRLYTQVQVQPGGSSSWKDGVSTCSPVTPPVSAAINLDRCWGNYLWTKNSSRQTGEKARFQSTNKTGCEFPLIFHQVQAGWTCTTGQGTCQAPARGMAYPARLALSHSGTWEGIHEDEERGYSTPYCTGQEQHCFSQPCRSPGVSAKPL